jgi:hypothetical protein
MFAMYAGDGYRGLACMSGLSTDSRPPDGLGLFVPTKRKYRRPIVLTPRQVAARRANAAKARTFACQANIQARTGLRPQWRIKYVPMHHRCTATSKRTKQRCRQWAMKKPGGGYFKTCYWHGAPGALGPVVHKEIYGRRMGPKQIARIEKKWRQRAAESDSSPPKKLPPLY